MIQMLVLVETDALAALTVWRVLPMIWREGQGSLPGLVWLVQAGRAFLLVFGVCALVPDLAR